MFELLHKGGRLEGVHLQVKAADLSILSFPKLNIRPQFNQLLPAQPCLLCGAMSRNGLCCVACNADLSRLSIKHCPNCALPTLAGEICGQCLQQPPHFDHAVAAFSYSFPIDQLVKALKFHERLILVNFLADELAKSIVTRPDMLIALPLHPLRLRERGFNQSQLLAMRIAAQLNIPFLSEVCHRTRDTPPQSTLPLKERDKNMRQAFAVASNANLSGKHVAIVDDVMTTGASIGALASALKQAGASEVSAWVVARTLPHK
jgi:ComF family protein